MELRHLRYFIAVAEELNFTRAAQRVHTAQPSLSQQIQQLEGQVGTPLLIRNKHRVALTEAGRVFLCEAKGILAKVDGAVGLALKVAKQEAKQVTLGVNSPAQIKVLPRILPLLDKRLPGLRVVVRSLLPTKEPTLPLRSGSIDLAFLRPPIDDPEIATQVVLRENIVVVLPKNHPLAGLRKIPARSLATIPLIAVDPKLAPGLCDVIQAFFREAGIKCRLAQAAENVLGNLNLVGAKLGFSLLPDYVEAILPENLVTRPLDSDRPPRIDLIAAYRKTEKLPVVQVVLQTLQESFPCH